MLFLDLFTTPIYTVLIKKYNISETASYYKWFSELT